MNSSHNKSWLVKFVDGCAERLLELRKPLLGLFVLLTIFFIYSATQIKVTPSILKTLPMNHPYMQNFAKYLDVFPPNTLLVNVRWKGQGDMYNNEYMDVIKKVTDEVFFIPGVNRTSVKSIFTPNTIFLDVTEEGFRGDTVVPAVFSGQPEELMQVRQNVAISGLIGKLVQNDLKGSMVQASLMEINPDTGEKLNYEDVAKQLTKLQRSVEKSNPNIEINIVGFAKIMGDIIDGFMGVFLFFAVAFLITFVLLLWYTRSLKLTITSLSVALLPVIWLFGCLPLAKLGIDPLSILVPFLIFSIGVSHAVQMTNAWKQEIYEGKTSIEASKNAFRKLFVPGTLALLTNALGFMVIFQIKIETVKELGITACLGVLLMIITNKMMLPIILSHLKLESASRNKPKEEKVLDKLWWNISVFTQKKFAGVALALSVVVLAGGTWLSRGMLVGDINPGVPELRPNSRYNIDTQTIAKNYDIGLDVLSVYVVSKDKQVTEGCLDPNMMTTVEKITNYARGIAGVTMAMSTSTIGKVVILNQNEGNPRWAAIPNQTEGLRQGAAGYTPEFGFNNEGCKVIQVLVFTKDHKAATISHVANELNRFIQQNPSPSGVAVEMAGGNVGMMLATNEEVEKAEITMLLSIFGAIAILCLLTFRSWKAVICILVPLAMSSILCNALMALLGIGLKVATLPVIALGVGVGVDYGIYIYERVQHAMYTGLDFRNAFYEAMVQRGTASIFTAATMTIGVGTWAFSRLQLQADMGILLAFMFMINAFGAIFLLPALRTWLDTGELQGGQIGRVV